MLVSTELPGLLNRPPDMPSRFRSLILSRSMIVIMIIMLVKNPIGKGMNQVSARVSPIEAMMIAHCCAMNFLSSPDIKFYKKKVVLKDYLPLKGNVRLVSR